MELPAASVIVRARNEQASIGRALALVRAQTVPAEIILVDSGSTDGTLETARPLCDKVLEIPPESFTYGRALNVGAAAASAPVHFALSAHCFPEQRDWIERSLAHYERADVAGTGGGHPRGSRVFFQDHAHARAHPYEGFSNHASSWRARVWQEFPFDETLGAAEDKEWGLRVTAAGWVLAFDPRLYVDLSHGWTSARELYIRERRCGRAISSFSALQSYGVDDAVREWWGGVPDDRHSAAFHRFVNYRRMAGIVGKWRGVREGRDDKRPPPSAVTLPDADQHRGRAERSSPGDRA